MNASTQQATAMAAIPLSTTIHLLRRLGLTLVGAVIRREPSPILARAIRRPEVRLLLPFAGRANAVSLSPYTIRPWLRQAGWFVGRELQPRWNPIDLQADLQREIERTLRHEVTERQWEKLANVWIDHKLGGISTNWLAEPFWHIAAEAAWGDPEFQVEVSRLLISALRMRVLFTPGEPPAPLVAPATFWALIALADIGKPAAWQLLLRRRAALLGLRRLQQTATRAALVPGWAGVWEQWLIVEALRIWNGSAKRLAPELRAALLTLPLNMRFSQAAESVEATSIDLTTSGWEQDLPPWIGTLARWDREPITSSVQA